MQQQRSPYEKHCLINRIVLDFRLLGVRQPDCQTNDDCANVYRRLACFMRLFLDILIEYMYFYNIYIYIYCRMW